MYNESDLIYNILFHFEKNNLPVWIFLVQQLNQCFSKVSMQNYAIKT